MVPILSNRPDAAGNHRPETFVDRGMKRLLFALYLVVEIAVFVALGQWLGYLTAILITVAATAIGVLMLRRTGARVLAAVGEALDGRRSAGPALADSATLAMAIGLLAVPGLVSTLAGMSLLTVPGRALARPVVAAFGAKKIAAAVDESTIITVLSRPGFGTVVDGQVEGQVVDSDGAGRAGSSSSSAYPGYPQLPRGLAD
jgi:UPF0716 protein FxsA